jgi:ketopantoate hydroxymethyltransferase
MIIFARSADIAPGKVGEAMAFAKEIAKLFEKLTGAELTVMTPIGGNPNQIFWRTTYKDLAGLEAAQTAAIADATYMAKIAGAAGLFLPGSVHDRIFKTVD